MSVISGTLPQREQLSQLHRCPDAQHRDRESKARRRQLADPPVTDNDDVASAEAKGVTVCTVYALDRTASAGLGVVGGVVGVAGGGGAAGG